MKSIPVVLTNAEGVVIDANDSARDLLGPVEHGTCHAMIRAVAPDGARVCTGNCAAKLAVGEQVDHRVVRVRGQAMRLVCTALDANRVVTLSAAPAAETGGLRLSPREREVLQLVARGFTSGRIARRLGISLSTARTHVEHIRDKLGVRTRSQAVAKAIALGEID